MRVVLILKRGGIDYNLFMIIAFYIYVKWSITCSSNYALHTLHTLYNIFSLVSLEHHRNFIMRCASNVVYFYVLLVFDASEWLCTWEQTRSSSVFVCVCVFNPSNLLIGLNVMMVINQLVFFFIFHRFCIDASIAKTYRFSMEINFEIIFRTGYAINNCVYTVAYHVCLPLIIKMFDFHWVQREGGMRETF